MFCRMLCRQSFFNENLFTRNSILYTHTFYISHFHIFTISQLIFEFVCLFVWQSIFSLLIFTQRVQDTFSGPHKATNQPMAMLFDKLQQWKSDYSKQPKNNIIYNNMRKVIQSKWNKKFVCMLIHVCFLYNLFFPDHFVQKTNPQVDPFSQGHGI